MAVEVIPRPCPACRASSVRDAGWKNDHHLVRCRTCRTLFTTLLPSGESLHDYYSQYYSGENLTVPLFVSRRLDEIVSGFARFRKTNRFLDVGCGAATLLEAARRAGWNAEGTEVSEVAANNARRLGFHVFCGGLAQANFASDRYDVVSVVEVLEHLLEPWSLLREVFRVLRPGGLLWLTTPNGYGISATLLGPSWSVISPPEHIQLFSVLGLRTLLRNAGFDHIRIAAHGVNPFEIASHFRHSEMTPNDRVSSSYALNERLTSGRSRRLAKAAINHVLSSLRLGDALKTRAVKGSTPRRIGSNTERSA
jgi:SAM-dependent methyltransferase